MRMASEDLTIRQFGSRLNSLFAKKENRHKAIERDSNDRDEKTTQARQRMEREKREEQAETKIEKELETEIHTR